MKAKLGQNAGYGGRLLIRELNPNPLANYLGDFKKARCFIAEQRQQFLGVESAIRPPEGEVDLRSVFSILCSAQLFGSVCRPLTKKTAKQGGQWE